MTINPFIFNDVYPDKDLLDCSREDAYELGIAAGIYLDVEQRSSLIRLIKREKQNNNDNNDGAYNSYWDNILKRLDKGDGL